MVDRPSNDQKSAKLKDAASLLLKGASLTNEPCPKCRGVQVKFKNKNICVNCDDSKSSSVLVPQPAPSVGKALKPRGSERIPSSIIEEKIVLLIQELRDESDLSIQKAKTDLLETYLRILEKTQALDKSESHE
ncbi:MAG TPA: Sjogren's syndrome/scleroderma autoantigen 1 family protein [Candidatus Nitrosopolaris sp.]|nr:Sjogren's syndrome/scleroderma autoantigen 1 family protein [Candidatus Nitrosopolaris sp.]